MRYKRAIQPKFEGHTYKISDSCAFVLFEDEHTDTVLSGVLILTTMNSFVGDFILRQKLYGPALTKAVLGQLPIPTREDLESARQSWLDLDFVRQRVLELTPSPTLSSFFLFIFPMR